MMTVVLFRDLSHAHYQGGTVSKRARELKDLARQSVGPAAEQTNRLVPAVHDAALTAKDRLSPAVEQARERVVPLLDDARTRVTPAVRDAASSAREKLGPVAEQAAERTRQLQHDVGPPVAAAVTAAAAASAPYRQEAKRRGVAAVAALRGEVEPPAKKHRFRKLLIVLGIGGAVAAAYKWFSGKDADDQWKQAYQPDVGPASDSYAAAAPATEDPAAAGPDEALADNTEEPHAPTTPDEPLEETAVEPTAESTEEKQA